MPGRSGWSVAGSGSIRLRAGEPWVHGQIPTTRKEDGPRELLPEREIRVLRVLGGSLSLPAIAAELRQPPNTTTAHTQAIYPSSASPQGMTPSPKEKRLGIL
jgi:hypothetical protein